MKRIRSIALIGAMIPLIGCTTHSADVDVPAVIVNPSSESHAALWQALTHALKMPVTIADDALTQTSLLTIERQSPRDIQNRPVIGRIVEKPEQFQLVLSRSRCVLIRLKDSSRWPLAYTTCTPELQIKDQPNQRATRDT